MSYSAGVLKEVALREFPLEKILDNSTTDFDLFLTIENHVVLYGSEPYHWQRRELENLLKHGYRHFLIRSEDEAKAKMYLQLAQLPLIDKNQAPPERIQSIEQVGAAFTKCLYEGDITPSCIEKAKVIADSLVGCIAEDPGCIKMLSGLGDHDYYTYYHSVRVATYTVAIAIQLGQSDPNLLREIALGGIFHDIGKKDVPLTVLNKTGPLTDDEWQKMRSHPEQGLNEVTDSILSHVPREIILHHHEKLDGSGYPHGLNKDSLLYEVQIATLADIFDALTSSRAYQQKRTRYEALDFIKHNLLKDKISAETYKALIACLVV